MKNKSGVENTKIVDLITHDPKSDEFVLIMIEERDWDGSIERMHQLQEKINNYLSFALDGQLAEKFPDSIDKPVRIQLDCTELPDPETKQFLDEIKKALKDEGVSFVVKLI